MIEISKIMEKLGVNDYELYGKYIAKLPVDVKNMVRKGVN